MVTKMLLLFVAESILLSVAVIAVLKSRFAVRGACWTAGMLLAISIFFKAPVMVQAAVTFVGTLICVAFGARSRAIWVVVFVTLVPCLIFGGALVALNAVDLSVAEAIVNRVSQLRADYPMASVADRLAYEVRTRDTGADPKSAAPDSCLSPEVEERLMTYEQQLIADETGLSELEFYRLRRSMLASLHSRTNEDFVAASGFGRRRIIDMREVHREGLVLPELGPIHIQTGSEPPYDSKAGSEDLEANADVPERLQPHEDALLAMHVSGLKDFLDLDRMGCVRDRDHVAGFQSHRFTKIPELASPKDQAQASWKIVRLELVSLLKHDVPVAYVSENLPQMDELRNAPTRPLDPFEQQAMDLLRANEDVAIDDTKDRIRMVGSLRAGRNCLECHSVRRGDLLGALTYELVPARQPARPEPKESPPSL